MIVQRFERRRMQNTTHTDLYFLIVSPDNDLIDSLRALLDEQACIGLIANDSAAARDVYMRVHLDAVIIDFNESIDVGLDLCRAIRTDMLTQQPLVFVVSNRYGDVALVDRMLEAGMDDLLPIRVNMRLARRRIEQFVRSTRYQRQLELQQQSLLESQHAEREQRLLAETLRDTTSLMTRTLNMREVIERIFENAARVVPHDAANIVLIENDVGYIRYTNGYDDATTARMLNVSYEISKTPAFYTSLATGKPFRNSNVKGNANWVEQEELPRLHDTQAYLCTPIKTYGQVIGFLNLDNFDGDAFSDSDVERMSAFGDQAAIAIVNAELYDAIFRDAAELNQLQQATSLLFSSNLLTFDNLADVGGQIAETVVRVFKKVDCGVMLLNADQRTLQRNLRAGKFNVIADRHLDIDSPGLVPTAVRLGENVYAPNVDDDPRYLASNSATRSELVIPLRTKNRVIGALDFQSSDLDAFSERDQETLSRFAGNAALVIENIQLLSAIREQERANAILTYGSDAIALANAQKGIQQVNPAFLRLFGYEPGEIDGDPLEDLATPLSRPAFLSALVEVYDTHESRRLEILAMRANGRTFSADMMLSPIRALNDGSVTNVICSVRDISDRKKLELDLEQSLIKERELVELKSQFIRHASHELRNPLASVRISTELLMMVGERKTPAERAERLKGILDQTTILTRALDELLDLNNFQHLDYALLHPSTFDLVEVIQYVINQIERVSSVQHRFEVIDDGKCHVVSADREKVASILRHLIQNAVKFSDANTCITLSLECGDMIMISVRDEGIGIPKEHHRHIYEPFYRVRTELHEQYASRSTGVGLGLTIVKQAVDLHRGQILFETTEGQGTIFRVVLPKQ